MIVNVGVSIHARLATGDDFRVVGRQPIAVSIHARLATGDDRRRRSRRSAQVSIHARLATGDVCATVVTFIRVVSIHARLATGDIIVLLGKSPSPFQFTPVLRRATESTRLLDSMWSFNSRPSCDGRPWR